MEWVDEEDGTEEVIVQIDEVDSATGLEAFGTYSATILGVIDQIKDSVDNGCETEVVI